MSLSVPSLLPSLYLSTFLNSGIQNSAEKILFRNLIKGVSAVLNNLITSMEGSFFGSKKRLGRRRKDRDSLHKGNKRVVSIPVAKRLKKHHLLTICLAE
jgi:hypothetical protein